MSVAQLRSAVAPSPPALFGAEESVARENTTSAATHGPPSKDNGPKTKNQGLRYEFFRLCAHDACVDCTLPQVKALTSKTRSKRAAGLR